MAERDDRTTRTSGMTTWRAGCGESRTSGSEGGPGKPTRGKPGRAPRPDPYTKLAGPARWTWFYLYVILLCQRTLPRSTPWLHPSTHPT
jgi:hypothetical protein